MTTATTTTLIILIVLNMNKYACVYTQATTDVVVSNTSMNNCCKAVATVRAETLTTSMITAAEAFSGHKCFQQHIFR